MIDDQPENIFHGHATFLLSSLNFYGEADRKRRRLFAGPR